MILTLAAVQSNRRMWRVFVQPSFSSWRTFAPWSVLVSPPKEWLWQEMNLRRPVYETIEAWLTAVGKELETMQPTDSLWPDTRHGRGITSGTFYTNLRRYLKKAALPPGGVHVFRHSAAKLRRDAGESIEDVSRFLDHSSLAVTTTYLRRLEGQEEHSWAKVAAAIGIGTT